MHVTFYKAGEIPVPPQLYGGTQRVIYWLGKALLAMGDQVTLIAPPGSQLPGADVRPFESERNPPDAWQRLVPDQTDVVHLWDARLAVPNRPALVTVEGFSPPGRQVYSKTVFVSKRQEIR